MSVIGFEIRTAKLTPGTYVVSVTGEIDAFTSPALEQELEWVLGDGASNAVVDLCEVGFLDSTALRVLLKVLPRFSKRGGKLVLVTEDRRVLRTFEITGLDGRFTLEPKLADAIAQFADGSSPVRAENGGSPRV
jgi:anti-sigma B factor antagonist